MVIFLLHLLICSIFLKAQKKLYFSRTLYPFLCLCLFLCILNKIHMHYFIVETKMFFNKCSQFFSSFWTTNKYYNYFECIFYKKKPSKYRKKKFVMNLSIILCTRCDLMITGCFKVFILELITLLKTNKNIFFCFHDSAINME